MTKTQIKKNRSSYADSVDQEQGSEDHSNSSWWEFYTVRYLLGTAIGTIVLLFLIHHHPDAMPSELVKMLQLLFPQTSLSGYQAAILGLSGLAYCYTASAPILFLHAFRNEVLTKTHGIGLGIALVFSIGFAYWLSALKYFSDISSSILFGVAIFFLLLQVLTAILFLVIVTCKPDQSTQLKFYSKLAIARGYANSAEKEYIESYRHLREHANALLIVLLEIVLAILLYYSPQRMWGYEICGWILPGALIYFFAQLMENRFVRFEL